MAQLGRGVLLRFYDRLLAPTFRPAELMTYDELARAVDADETHGLVALEAHDPVAGIVTEEYVDGQVLLVAYLVVAEVLRSRGIGAELLRQAAGERNRLVLAEIDDPRFHPVDPLHGDPAARVKFYDRVGSRLLPIPYTQPSLREGSPRAENLLLVTIPSAEPTTDDLDGRLVARFLDEYYTVCEGGDVTLADPEYLALREAALGESGRLQAVSLSDLARARPGRVPSG